MLELLPHGIQALAQSAYRLYVIDPSHTSLAHHALDDTKKSRQRNGSFTVSVGSRYRAIYVPDDGDNVWYWIGTHEAYNNLVGKT